MHGIRLTFDQTNSGAIYVANIRLSNQPVTLSPQGDTGDSIEEVPQGGEPALPQLVPHTGVLTAVRRLPAVAQLGGASGVEIEIASNEIFPVRDAMLTLRIGSQYFTLSRYVGGDLHRVVFSLTNAEFTSLSAGDPVMVQYGMRTAGQVWDCGKLDLQIVVKK